MQYILTCLSALLRLCEGFWFKHSTQDQSMNSKRSVIRPPTHASVQASWAHTNLVPCILPSVCFVLAAHAEHSAQTVDLLLRVLR